MGEDKHCRGPSTPRHKRCVPRSIGKALRSEAVTFLISSWPESCEEHVPISIAGVLRLRAVSPVLSDPSARRFAQDDDSVVGIKNIGSSAKNTKRSKKCTSSPTAGRGRQDDDSVGELTERRSLRGSRGTQQVPRLPPDFLSGLVESVNLVRLSLEQRSRKSGVRSG
jgi:hypothetical protein